MPEIKEKPKKENLLTLKEMAMLMKVEERTLVEWVQYRKIPYILVNKQLIRFRLSDIADWINKKQLQNQLKDRLKTSKPLQ